MAHWSDFKKAYEAGGDAYRKKTGWIDWVIPITVVPILAAEICRHHSVSWPLTVIAMVVTTMLLMVLLAGLKRAMRR